jgi:hypothetical protein
LMLHVEGTPGCYAHPSSRTAQPAFQTFVMGRILSPSNSIT